MVGHHKLTCVYFTFDYDKLSLVYFRRLLTKLPRRVVYIIYDFLLRQIHPEKLQKNSCVKSYYGSITRDFDVNNVMTPHIQRNNLNIGRILFENTAYKVDDILRLTLS